jgi:membrane-bound metal-dependent hydrolase YbcI (DUF457 family)
MTGETHAATGVLLGFGLAAADGLPTAEAVLVAVVIGGYALAPDLDCAKATASRLLGPVTALLSWLLIHSSAIAFRCTRTTHDRASAGTHRHLSHTAVFAVLLGVLAQWSASLSPWAVAGWAVFGLLAAGAALHTWVTVVGMMAALAPVVLDHVSVYAVCASAQPWIGPAVAAGCLVHIVGDAMTVSGVPLLWPLPLGKAGQRQTWYEVHFLPAGFRLHTGKRVERWLVLPVVLTGCVFAAPGVAPQLLALLDTGQHVTAQITDQVTAHTAAGGAR